MRVQTISFFLVGLLLSSWFVQLLWNYLRRDFSSLPRLSYGKALGAVILWGLLFELVLTMISGARELMTPGAWEKQGLTYRLAQDREPAPQQLPREPERRESLDRLRIALWEYAEEHDGHFPDKISGSDSSWQPWPMVPCEGWICGSYAKQHSAPPSPATAATRSATIGEDVCSTKFT